MLHKTERAVLAHFRTTGPTSASNATLAAELGVSSRTFSSALSRLGSLTLVEVDRRDPHPRTDPTGRTINAVPDLTDLEIVEDETPVETAAALLGHTFAQVPGRRPSFVCSCEAECDKHDAQVHFLVVVGLHLFKEDHLDDLRGDLRAFIDHGRIHLDATIAELIGAAASCTA